MQFCYLTLTPFTPPEHPRPDDRARAIGSDTARVMGTQAPSGGHWLPCWAWTLKWIVSGWGRNVSGKAQRGGGIHRQHWKVLSAR